MICLLLGLALVVSLPHTGSGRHEMGKDPVNIISEGFRCNP
jgi:hypothetical protein